MARTQTNPLLRFLRRLAGAEAPLDSDADLLRRFAEGGDRSAFELVLWRHGPMVLKVCRTVLRDGHDAEDAFQAAFLTLARKAASIGRREALGAWLYRVAYRIALKLHRQARRRTDREAQGVDVATLSGDAPERDTAADAEVRRLLHAEVERLPAKYRAPVVLCYLEGRTNEQAAAQLGWSKGTVSGRLARARDLLRHRLERCGLPASAAFGLTLFAAEAAAVPCTLMTPTLTAAVTAAAGGSLAGVVSPQVIALTEGALHAMASLPFKFLAGLFLGVTAAGAVAYSGVAGVGGDKQAGAKEPPAAVKVIRVPSPRDGILLAVGAELKKNEPAPKGARLLEVKLGKEVRRYRRLLVGDKVEEGQMLAQLDDRLARNELAVQQAKLVAAKADHTAAVATFKEARARLDRLDELRKRNAGLVSPEDYSGAVLTRDKYAQEEVAKREAVKVAELGVERVQTILEMYTIRSPVAGTVRVIRLHRGEAVRALETLVEIEPWAQTK